MREVWTTGLVVYATARIAERFNSYTLSRVDGIATCRMNITRACCTYSWLASVCGLSLKSRDTSKSKSGWFFLLWCSNLGKIGYLQFVQDPIRSSHCTHSLIGKGVWLKVCALEPFIWHLRHDDHSSKLLAMS